MVYDHNYHASILLRYEWYVKIFVMIFRLYFAIQDYIHIPTVQWPFWPRHLHSDTQVEVYAALPSKYIKIGHLKIVSTVMMFL